MAAAFVLVIAAGAVTDFFLLDNRIRHVKIAFHHSTSGQTWLIVGSDSRASVPGGPNVYGTTTAVPGQRADVVLLVHSDGTYTHVLSLPRDLLVSPKAGEIDRLTLTLQLGPQAVVDSLCNTLNVAVTRFVEITMAGFAHVVDTVGGVTVTIPYPIRDAFTGLNITRTGQVHLNGTQALALVRSRTPQQLIRGRWVGASEPAGAADRTRWAGTVFTALQHKAKNAVPDPFAMQSLAWAGTGALTTDNHTGLTDLFGLRGAGAITDVPAAPVGKTLAVSPDAATTAALHAAGLTSSCH